MCLAHESKGFEPHFDFMDVVVIQIQGSKEWTMYVLVREPRQRDTK
jgi:ribosomal protein L16 Arg81 hydroxylase